jgi:transposase
MLSLPLPVRIFLCTQPADMRRSFDGLAQMVREFLGADPLCGHLFVFRSKRGDRLKLLYWDSDGLAQLPQFEQNLDNFLARRCRKSLMAFARFVQTAM